MRNPRTGRDAGVRGSIDRHDDDSPTVPAVSDVLPAALRRRRAAFNSCEPLPDGRRDPLADEQPDDWSLHEVDSWGAAAEHLGAHGLYGHWQYPLSVRRAWRAHREVAS